MKFSKLGLALTAFFTGAGVAKATDLLSTDPAPAAAVADAPAAPSPAQAIADFNPNRSLAPLVKALQPAVVNIYVKQRVPTQMMSMHPFFSPFFGEPSGTGQSPEYQVKTGQGSGFLISADGYLLTNNHVVADADEVMVKLSDDREFAGKVVGTDSRVDIALIKIETDGALPFVEMGESEGLEVGDWVVAIGNPFGLSHTVTAGIVSAKGRVIGAGPYDDFIQTDASINPGNSGGPLFDLSGRVVGINTAINASGQGIGFAVPVDMVTPFLDDLKAHGHISRGWLGISLQSLDADLAESMGVEPGSGVLVSEVHEGQPADKAGLVPGDLIVQLGDDPVSDSQALVRAVGGRSAGEKVVVQILRDGQSKTLKVALGERPSEERIRTARFEPKAGKSGKRGQATQRLGIGVQPSPSGGLVVGQVTDDSPADGRLRPGDRIIEANGARVRTGAELDQALRRNGRHAVLVVRRGNARVYVAIPLE
jgi:serine protease Do